MASTEERLVEDMNRAQKEQDKLRLGAIRWMRDTLQKHAKEAGKSSLDDTEAAEVLGKLAKKYKESIEQARQAGRVELAEKEEAELRVLEEYLPKQLSNAEIEEMVRETISEVGAKGPGDMGAVMKALKPRWAGRADGKTVSEIVKAKLNEPAES